MNWANELARTQAALESAHCDAKDVAKWIGKRDFLNAARFISISNAGVEIHKCFLLTIMPLIQCELESW
jgi:hypothetical protein